MDFPPVPHFGTTLEATPVADGADPWSFAPDEMMGRTDRFLRALDLDVFARNDFGPLGRQLLYRRGEVGDADYFEKDSFGSYTSKRAPASQAPRVGEAVFRLTHAEPDRVLETWQREDLVEVLAEGANGRLLRGPDLQTYELVETPAEPLGTNVIYVWTAAEDVDAIARDLADQFALRERPERLDFYGRGEARLFRRPEPSVTLGLLVPADGSSLAPRWTDDIFAHTGYSHFRLWSPDKARVKSLHREAFPDTGPVSYVHFHHTYLELIEA